MHGSHTYPRAGRIRLLHRIALIGLATNLLVTVFALFSLPPRIPIHFGLDGQPDAQGPSWLVLLLPAIGLGIYLLFRQLDGMPHTFNYPYSIDDHNRKPLYAWGRHLLASLNAFIQLLFLYIDLQMIRIALDQAHGLGVLALPFILLALGGLIFWHMYHMRTFKPQEPGKAG